MKFAKEENIDFVFRYQNSIHYNKPPSLTPPKSVLYVSLHGDMNRPYNVSAIQVYGRRTEVYPLLTTPQTLL